MEVANGPIAGNVDETLEGRGVRIVPDVLANAGGVIVSYFEWVQNRSGYAWTLEEVRARLDQVLKRTFAEMWSVHEEEKLPLRSAAYAVAMRRLAGAIESQGTRDYFQTGQG